MRRRHPLDMPLPKLWLMTDERQGEALWPALKKLPRGSGVIVRHYSLEDSARLALIARIRKIATARRIMLIIGGPANMAIRARADGFHERSRRRTPRHLHRTVAVHNLAELRLAERVRADLVFISPVFGTASHPGGSHLGRARFGKLAQASRSPVIALGGMNTARARSLRQFGIYGWAAIGALTPNGSDISQ